MATRKTKSRVKPHKTSPLKVVLLALLVVILISLLLNFGYWSKQAGYLLSRSIAFSSESSGQQRPAQSGKIEPNMLRIERLGIKAPIVYIDEQNESAYQEGLKNGVVHYPGTAEVGDLGNTYIFGHSSDYVWKGGKYKTVFALLPKIKIGDEIVASDKEGNKFVYTVTNAFVASAQDTHLLDQYDNERHLLTLQTSYPLGTALKRYIVTAELK